MEKLLSRKVLFRTATFCFASAAVCWASTDYACAASYATKNKSAFTGAFQPYTLGEIIPISSDVALFRFLFDDPETEFNMRPCSTLQAQFQTGPNSADKTQRFYTPVTPNHTKGFFDIIVKRKPDGRMTNHIFGLHPGDQLKFRNINYKLKYEPNKWKEVGMIAGGTGFTPMLQVIRHALYEFPHDKTRLSFIFCNRTEQHILLRGLIDKMAQTFPDRFRVFYSVDCPIQPEQWKGGVGYLTKEVIKEHMPPPSRDTLILLCGPDNLMWHVAGCNTHLLNTLSSGKSTQPVAMDLANMTTLGGILAELGYEDSNVYRF